MRLLAALALVCCSAFAGEIEGQRLPAEARQTLERIKAGGPFAYPQDGRVFSNRERLLPAMDRGYYREYTVRTPGARDRGARRIVAGSGGEYYYTDDHYRSFRRIRE
jgi:ribonuclease T1